MLGSVSRNTKGTSRMNETTCHTPNRHIGFCLSAAILGLLASRTVLANGFRNPPAGAAALAQDGGKVALVDDATAVAHNPANLVNVKQGALATVTFVDAGTDLTTPYGKVSTKDSLILLPNVYYVQPFADTRYTAGVGLTTPYGQSVEWPSDRVVDYYAEMKMITLSPTLAARLNKQLSLGVGADLSWSALEMRSMLYDGLTPLGSAKLEGDGVGVSGTLGLTWQITASQRGAITYRTPFEIDYEGDTTVSVPPVVPLAPASDFSGTIDFPDQVALGYGLQLTETVSLGADVEWIGFSRFKAMHTDYGVNNAAGFPRSIPQNWDDIWTAGVAGAWRCTPEWTLRATYKYLESPIPDQTLSTTLPDADKHIVGIGAGWSNGRHRLDVGYAYSLLDDRTVTDNVVPYHNGVYELDSQLASITYAITL